jgi:hypothetical protein
MFSDPIESSSSDVESYDEDDMYGTDSEIESIPLHPVKERPALDIDHDSVSIYLSHHVLLLHMIQGARHH